MRAIVSALVASVLLVVLVAGQVSAASGHRYWHRLNPGEAPEHERLDCTKNATWLLCLYDKKPTPGYHYDATIGRFHGYRTTDTWVCPNWFPAEICDNVLDVYRGRARYYSEEAGISPRIAQDYIITRIGGQLMLHQYWVGQFVCPWHKTWNEAKAANPDGESDCAFAPG